MKKIYFEDIAGYLPYGLRVNMISRSCATYDVSLMNCGLDYNATATVSEWYFSRKGATFGLNDIKPIVRPLSDLTKEIEHDGKKFVPIDELAEWLYGEEPESFGKKEDARSWIDFNLGGSQIVGNLPFKLVRKLIKWHFDIHNWIGDGLAISNETQSY